MTLKEEDIRHITKLARLRFGEDLETYRAQMDSILEYIGMLQELNTDDVPEFMHAADQTNQWREDVVEGCGEDVRKRLIEAFPAKEGELLKVQAVFEGRKTA